MYLSTVQNNVRILRVCVHTQTIGKVLLPKGDLGLNAMRVSWGVQDGSLFDEAVDVDLFVTLSIYLRVFFWVRPFRSVYFLLLCCAESHQTTKVVYGPRGTFQKKIYLLVGYHHLPQWYRSALTVRVTCHSSGCVNVTGSACYRLRWRPEKNSNSSADVTVTSLSRARKSVTRGKTIVVIECS